MSYFLPSGMVPPEPASRENHPFYNEKTKDSFPNTTTPMPMPTTDELKNWKVPGTVTYENLPSIDDPSEIEQMLSDLLLCDDIYCPDVRSMISDVILEMARVQEPKLYMDIVRCSTTLPSDLDIDEWSNVVAGTSKLYTSIEQERMRPQLEACQSFHQRAADSAGAQMMLLMNQQRAVSSGDRLYDYDAQLYPHPFWFEGAGDIWRRISHNSIRVSVDDCAKVRRTAEQCILDRNKPNDYCFNFYKHAIVCEPGANCPYLRFPMMRCLDKHHDGNYQTLKNCIDMLPNVELCRQGFVPVDFNDQNPTSFTKPERVRSSRFDGF